MPDSLAKQIIGKTHPIYDEHESQWEEAERRLEGGAKVREELTPFEFEDAEDTEGSYAKRKSKAIYLPLPKETAEKFVGTLNGKAPLPGEGLSFGQMGTVRPEFGGSEEQEAEEAGSAELTQAEQVWQSADSAGTDGSNWRLFFDRAQRGAMATGWRWILVAGPAQRPDTRQDELDGKRPYLVEYSPLNVPYWHYESGTLQAIRIEVTQRRPRVEAGKLTDEEETVHYVYVRPGFEGFGDDYKAGGWWKYDKEGEELGSGSFQTGGEIPVARFFYERGQQFEPNSSPPSSGLDEVGSIASALMDLESAGRNDALEGGSRKIFAVGIKKDAHKGVLKQMKGGSRFIGVEGDGEGSKPALHDMASVSASEAIDNTMDRLFAWARMIATKELATSPDASGKARQVQYEAEVSPRLAHMAIMRMEIETWAIHMFERRFGYADPTGRSTWPTKYDLQSALEKILKLFEALSRLRVSSPTLASKAALQAAEDADVELDEEETAAVREELQSSADRNAQAGAMGNSFGL